MPSTRQLGNPNSMTVTKKIMLENSITLSDIRISVVALATTRPTRPDYISIENTISTQVCLLIDPSSELVGRSSDM